VNILGLWDGHDSGAALLVDGRLVAALNEERFTRRKLDSAFPYQSIAACLEMGGLRPSAVDAFASCTTDVAKALARLFPSTREAYYQVRRRKAAPGIFAEVKSRAKYRLTEWPPNWASRVASRWAFTRALTTAGFRNVTLRLYDHHACHAAAAAYGSRFDSCLVVTIDGVGDGKSATVSRFADGRLVEIGSTPALASPGVFFEHVTHLLNMRELEDEGKVMALADYASPVPDQDNPLLSMLTVRDLSFVTARPGHRLKRPLRRVLWRYPNEQFAYMAQRALEEACVTLVGHALDLTGERRIALAGGVTSNIKVNRRLRLLPGVEQVFVFPHMGDGGLPVGAAALAQAELAGPPDLRLDKLDLGSGYDDDAIEAALIASTLPYQRIADVPSTVCDLLASERIVLWFQGRMEYGPRSLGHRSVLARPDRPGLRDRLNLVLKRRVWYQPFCPSLLESDARAALCDFSGLPNRHMTMAYLVAPNHRESLSGVINVDGSCRPQMVADEDPGPFAALLRKMRARIGIGAVLNTSFNIHGAPVVRAPDEAMAVFRESGADALAIGPFLVSRESL
jgi:carbamoyltransferase